jgi:cyanuric acid amidohydrolase
MRADVHRFDLPDPGDVSGLRAAIDGGTADARQIVGVIGKTHGNGLVNDYTRGFLAQSLSLLIAEKTGETPAAVRRRIPFIFSGGVEGVLSPHYVVFTVADGEHEASAKATSTGKALAVGVGFTPDLRPEDIGRRRQIDLTAAAVKTAMASAGITDPADVHFVQVKGPAFTLAEIVDSRERGRPAAVEDPGKLMGFGRAASALGVGKALGEITPEQASEAALLNDFGVYSSVASCSAGVEVKGNEIIVLGMSDKWTGPLAIAHAVLGDALDVDGVRRALDGLGFAPRCQLSAAEARRLRAGFVKCEADRSGRIRGRAHTMLNDGDIDQQRHIRAAVGAVVASVINDTAIFVSGGAEHQGPAGGGFIALIAERP